MTIKVASFQISNTKVWITIQPLSYFKKETLELSNDTGFLCYFRFSDPFAFQVGELVNFTEGELIMDENNKPKIFLSEEKIESFAKDYIQERLEK